MSGDAVDAALRVLRHRDRSELDLDRRLAEHGFSASEREDALERLSRTGVVDDRRFALARAALLAERGAGDRMIRHALHVEGVAGDLVDEAVASLACEEERARRVVVKRGTGAKTVRYLLGKGFGHEVVAAVARDGEDELR